MIPLVIRAEMRGRGDEVVCRAMLSPSNAPSDATLSQLGGAAHLVHGELEVIMAGVDAQELAGDILLLQPASGAVQRLVRANSRHNTFLITERCDQLCVMCSQPPKKTHVDYFAHYKTAALLAPEGAVLGLSGGEPTLYKEELFDLLQLVLTLRPDLRFHVLSNAQHFVEEDIDFLSSEAGRKVLWGVPLYSHKAATHDRLVGKAGAFGRLLDGLAILCRSGAPTELRTVVMQDNVHDLPELARFITTHIPFADPWAIMQLENIGFARNRWRELFFDHSLDFDPIARAIETARIHGVPAILYNFPLCTVPALYRRFAPSTISDWKRRFEPACDGCVVKKHCGGFFEWHPTTGSYERLGFA